MDEIKKLHRFFALKEVERVILVKERQESTAEHVYSSLMLAQYFLPRIGKSLDEKKVMKIILYHDLVEIEAGDVFILDVEGRKNKKEKERVAFQKLKEQIPQSMVKEIEALWNEYEEKKTPEAKFCNAIDKLDPCIHLLEDKKIWQKYKLTEPIIRKMKDHHFKEFPQIMQMWNKIVEYAKKNGYFDGN